jgi:hypothetical protein
LKTKSKSKKQNTLKELPELPIMWIQRGPLMDRWVDLDGLTKSWTVMSLSKKNNKLFFKELPIIWIQRGPLMDRWVDLDGLTKSEVRLALKIK